MLRRRTVASRIATSVCLPSLSLEKPLGHWGPEMSDRHERRRRRTPGVEELHELYEDAVGRKCMSCGAAAGRARTFTDAVPQDELSNVVVLCDPCDEARRGASPVDPAFLSLIVSKTRRERTALGRALSPRNSRRVLEYLRMRAG